MAGSHNGVLLKQLAISNFILAARRALARNSFGV
jgi:hypothetical protein